MKNKSPYLTTKHIFVFEGPRSFFRGVSATLVCSMPSTALCFGAYESFKKFGLSATDGKYESLVYFSAGACKRYFSFSCDI